MDRANQRPPSDAGSALRRADARRNREAIVAAARSELRRDPRASMGDVASAAGLSRSTLYRHFPAREELVSAVAAGDVARAADTGRPIRDVRLPGRESSEGLILAAPAGARDLQRPALAEVRPPGQLGHEAPLVVDATHVLNEVPPYLVGEQLVAESERIAGVPVAVYAVDVDGSRLFRLAGGEEFPPALEGPLSVGPEIAPDALPELYRRLEAVMPDCHPYPMWLRGRAIGVLIALRRPRESLAHVARQGTAALELADHYTDAFEVARRRRETSAAAEVQLNLLPARNAQVAGGELAGSLLPSYEVGGDWFDYTENADGAWLAVADVAGDGAKSAAFGALALGALRASRRSGEGLEATMAAMERTVRELREPGFSISVILARWHAPTATFSWIACGPTAPVLWWPDGGHLELSTRSYPPLGRSRAAPVFERQERRLRSGDRVVLYSAGVPGRAAAGGRALGIEGVARAVTAMEDRSAAATARAIQEAVTSASEDPLEEDAAVVVLAIG